MGGLRAQNANTRQTNVGVFTQQAGTLTNDSFVNLLALGTEWRPTSDAGQTFEVRGRGSGELKWTGSRVDLVFGSNSELRALAEVYACDDAREKFVRDFVAAWNKVISLDRFDLAPTFRSTKVGRPEFSVRSTVDCHPVTILTTKGAESPRTGPGAWYLQSEKTKKPKQ